MNIELRMSILEVNLKKFQANLLKYPDLDLNASFEPHLGLLNRCLPPPYQDQKLPKLGTQSRYITDVVAMLGLMQSRYTHKNKGVSIKQAKEKLEILIIMLSSLFDRGAILQAGAPMLLEHLLSKSIPSACLFNQKQMLKLTQIFLTHGYDANTKLIFDQMLIWHPLVYYNKMNIQFKKALKLFVTYGFDVESHTMLGMTPLMLAIYKSDYHAVRFLLDQGANIHQSIYQHSSHRYNIDGPLYLRSIEAWELRNVDLYEGGLTEVEELKRPKLNRAKRRNHDLFTRMVKAEITLCLAGYEPISAFAELALRHQQLLMGGHTLNLSALINEIFPTASLKKALQHRFPEYRREWQERLNHLSLKFHLRKQPQLSNVTMELIESYYGSYEPIACLSEVKQGVFFQRVGGVTHLSKSANILKLEHRLRSASHRLEKRPSNLSQPD